MLASRTQLDEPPVINMTPMVDVILCLLVFFMAATRLYDWDESEFSVNVPEVAEAAPLSAAPDDLMLTVTTWTGWWRCSRKPLPVTRTRAWSSVAMRRLTIKIWPTFSPPAMRPAFATSASPSARELRPRLPDPSIPFVCTFSQAIPLMGTPIPLDPPRQ